MEKKSVYKIPNGKLIKVFLNFDPEKNIIKKIRINGDFFAYPEDSIEIIESKLVNLKLEKDILISKIKQIVDEFKMEFIGLNHESLATGILMCLK